MPDTVIDRLFTEHGRLREHLGRAGETSLAAETDAQFRKVLLLSAASYFETAIRETLLSYFEKATGNDQRTLAFVKAKGIERQYHTYFKWDANNANTFFALFGGDFKVRMEARVRVEADLREGVRAFLELGELRNNLVHRDYANYPLEKTVDEIYALYRSAVVFVEAIGPALAE